MYFNDLSHQILLLTFTCFPFLVVIITLWLHKESSYQKLLGVSFVVPFILTVAALLIPKVKLGEPLILSGEVLFCLIFFLLLLLKPGSKRYKTIFVLLWTSPFLLIFCLYQFAAVKSFVQLPLFYISALVSLSLGNLWLLKNKKGHHSLLFWAMLCILASNVARLIGSFSYVLLTSAFLYLSAFILFAVYFCKDRYIALTKTVEEAEKTLNAVNKSLNLEVKKRVLEIELSNEKLVEISKTDALTKALNKAGILDKIDHLINVKKDKEFCILMFDIDSFKSINDTLGHVIGDKCLKKLSLIAKDSIRDIDSLGRYGGDEFIIILPRSNVNQAKIISERFRKNVAATENPHFTISLGIAAFPHDGKTVKELIEIADQGLYASKKKGKNAVSYKDIF